MERKTVTVFMGGRSSEREVSLVSGSAVARAIDRRKYSVLLVHIRQDGAWEETEALHEQAHLVRSWREAVDPDRHPYTLHSDLSEAWSILSRTDMAFPVLHGPFGEDGTIQGLLETAGIPYVGGGVLFCSVCMHKPTLKSLLLQHGIPTPPFRTVRLAEWREGAGRVAERLADELGMPVFVKPAALGSSIGVSKVKRPEELGPALLKAFRYGREAVVEKAVPGAREIECAVMGNEAPWAARHLGEVVPWGEFYDYESKYVHDSQLYVPARGLSVSQVEQIREMALAAYRLAGGAGYARVDFLVNDDGPMLNEINAIPGFTEISMFPRLFMADGLSFAQIVDTLISLAWERFGQATSA